MDSPLVSCIMIFFNAERFIEEAIGSVLAQSYQNWELLLVDDGSADASPEIALRYARLCQKKIRYLHHPGRQNRGMSASRNLGIGVARGQYLAFLDADDIWLPDKLDKQLESFRAVPEAGMVCGATLFWFSWTGHCRDLVKDSLRRVGARSNVLYLPPTLLSPLILDQVKTPATCSVLIRKTVVDEAEGFDEAFRGMYEDQAFFAKLYLKTVIYVTDDCQDWYRQHPNSCCALAEGRSDYDPNNPNLAHLRFLKWLRQYLITQQVVDQGLEQSLELAFAPYRHPWQLRFVAGRKRSGLYFRGMVKACLGRRGTEFLRQKVLVRRNGGI